MVLKLGTRLAHLKARDELSQPDGLLRRLFIDQIDENVPVDAEFVDSTQRRVVGAAGMSFKAPVVAELLKDLEVYRYLSALWQDGGSLLILGKPGGRPISLLRRENGRVRSVSGPPVSVLHKIAEVFATVPAWAGELDCKGRQVADLRSPSPGPHYFVNVLLGNRIGYPRPLQTTPKSVVDRLGRGSLRSHAATQVLATRWDMRPEENGFPANRQFYLVEGGQQIFYSADPTDPNVASARAVHGQNCTTITYKTQCGLEIERTIFLLPYDLGLPLATEVQSISIANLGGYERKLRIVVTGMFGAAAPGALQEDVIYTSVSMQSSVMRRDDGAIAAISPDYNSAWNKEDVRFHSMIVHANGQTTLPTEFCSSYNELVGEGTLEAPEGIRQLSNKLARKGPGFFALAAEFALPAGEAARVDNFTGMVSSKLDPHYDDHSAAEQITRLLERYSDEAEVDRALARNRDFVEGYLQHVHIASGDPLLDQYVNNNLPFQLLYQTFFSRSFCLTQKGYREIGFREIQDLFASTPFLIAMGYQWFVKELLKEWASQIHEFGYANHNFYWAGKEPGEFSDDALWFIQAVAIYLNQTGDLAFLDEECPMAPVCHSDAQACHPERSQESVPRSIYATIQAVLRYSGEISIGHHGLPLLDKADWNDTLRLDYNFLDGPQKEAAYRDQIAAGGRFGEPFKSDHCESVMNAFLLRVAYEATQRIAERRGDFMYAASLRALSNDLRDSLQRHAWKGDFFARVLFNRYADGRFTYLGAGGDGLSADPSIDGTYFLNSFSWAVLAEVATEEQIRVMVKTIKRVLLTTHGLKLCSPVNYGAVSERGGSGEYFPGDRENGGVFKHANMMATAALFKAAKEVRDIHLAAELARLAYVVIEKVLPFQTLLDPYVLAGNPRFCTQYNNSETGENIGPLLSGTSTWLWLTLMSAYGLEMTPDGIALNPILREDQRRLGVTLNTGAARYHMEVTKPKGFHRARDGKLRVEVDGHPLDGNRLPLFEDGEVHEVKISF